MNSNEVTIDNCAKEKIHIPGLIQPHGHSFIMTQDMSEVLWASDNCKALNCKIEDIFQRGLTSFLSQENYRYLKTSILEAHIPPPIKIRIKETNFNCIYSFNHNQILIEFERVLEEHNEYHSHGRLIQILEKFEKSRDIEELSQILAQESRNLTGFDRVMIYQFDENWNGKVIGEAKSEDQDSFFGLNFPANDIPEQARRLYTINLMRLIPDVEYDPIPLLPNPKNTKSEPADLSFSTLRSVSPIHLQYLKNMNVYSSMSISILREGKLWGLIAFHHAKPLFVNYEKRLTLELLGKFMGTLVTAKIKLLNNSYRTQLKSIRATLQSQMKEASHFTQGLIAYPTQILDLAKGVDTGFIFYQKKLLITAKEIDKDFCHELVTALTKRSWDNPVFTTRSIGQSLGEQFFKSEYAGLACISIPEPTPFFIVLLKKEVLQTVKWGGNPYKKEIINETLSPRKSFSLWKEEVKGNSLAWSPEEKESFEEMRLLVIESDLEFQVKKALRSNQELDEYSNLVSHDLKEPVRGIKGLSQILKRDMVNISKENLEILNIIIALSIKSEQMIKDLYEYSRLNKIQFSFQKVSSQELIMQAKEKLAHEKKVRFKIANNLPVVRGDKHKLEEVFYNLFSNAIKYNDKENPLIEVSYQDEGESHHFIVSDNGMGIPQEYQANVFKLFTRFSPSSEIEGSGYGLAIVQRIVTLHEGRIWVDSKEHEGSQFHFTLKKRDNYD